MNIRDMAVSPDQVAHDLGIMTDLAWELAEKADGSLESQERTMAILGIMKVAAQALADFLEPHVLASLAKEHETATT